MEINLELIFQEGNMLSFKMIVLRDLLVLTFVSQFLYLHGQTLNKIDSAKYSCAYKFIKNTTDKRIKVSRCIVDLDRWVFPFDSLSDLPKEKNALMAFVERKKNGRNEDYFSDEIAAQTFDVKKPQNILYFSQIEDNMLVACLLPFDKRRHRMKDIDRIDIICRFNESENFLFVFDDNNKIKKVIKVLVNYE